MENGEKKQNIISWKIPGETHRLWHFKGESLVAYHHQDGRVWMFDAVCEAEGDDMGVSENRGTPKWMVKIMENPIKMDDLGVPPFKETPICVGMTLTFVGILDFVGAESWKWLNFFGVGGKFAEMMMEKIESLALSLSL